MHKWWNEIKDLFQDKTVRKQTLKYILLADLLLLLAALFLDRLIELTSRQFNTNEVARFWNNLLGQSSSFTGPQWVALITPALALLMARYAHKRDQNKQGRGVKDIITTHGRHSPYNLETDVIAASMTKQSVLAAIASILTVVIQQLKDSAGFPRLVTSIATFGFAFTILFLLVSMVCYDYASRFHWKTFYKAQLVRKALLLDVYSWYLLLTSFILSIALISPWLSIVTCFASGILMWWYYFFPKEGPGDALNIRGISGHVIKVKNIKEAEKFYCNILGLETRERDGKQLSVRVGNWTEITLLEELAGDSTQELAFMMAADDFKLAGDVLKRGHISYTCDTRHSTSGIELEVIRFKDPDNNSLELRAPASELKKDAGK
jgi:catechol 2,3-dioxygenase-like lactoylglutathione lyase family enzyme/uncharacterized membrane protein